MAHYDFSNREGNELAQVFLDGQLIGSSGQLEAWLKANPRAA